MTDHKRGIDAHDRRVPDLSIVKRNPVAVFLLLPGLVAALLGLASCQTNGLSSGAPLLLAKNGVTGYVIVKPDPCTDVDDYAVGTLTNFLFQKTGAVFPVVSPSQGSPTNGHIFVGVSGPVLGTLGPNPLLLLKDQEYTTRSVGNDIFLYGQGIHGNFHAVVDFIETSLGRRWYSKFDQPVFDMSPDLAINSFDRKGGFSFPYRWPRFPGTFDYHLGGNMGFSEYGRPAKDIRARQGGVFSPGVVSRKIAPAIAHTTFSYIPPGQKKIPYEFPWVTNRNYFQTNPGFFSMDKTGKRVPAQLCFSNPKLREELTKNIVGHIRYVEDKDVIIGVTQEDNPGSFCECPECKKREAVYASVGGPLYDYLFELCPIVKKEHPDATIVIYAYRLSQTQKPPVLPEGRRFPGNVVVLFCNVEDKLDRDWNSPLNRPTYEDLLAWRKLTPHIWVHTYPNPYGAAACMPFSNIKRQVTDIRLMQEAGVEGVEPEFTTPNMHSGDGFTELQKYLYYRLARDVNSDVPALIREFTDYQYGAAAPLARKYLNELEDARKTSATRMPLGVSIIDFNAECAYLTSSAIYRWQGYFDQMAKDTAADARCLKNVRRLRRTLEFATLCKWKDLTRAYPDYFKDYAVHKPDNIPAWAVGFVEDCEIIIKTAGTQRPLPAQFTGMNPACIRRLVPYNEAAKKKVTLDPDAAFGYATTVDQPNLPFTFGFYQQDTGTRGAERKLESADIKPGRYQVYRLGTINATPDCRIWFGLSWATKLQLGSRLYIPGEENLYDTYVSLKFEKPMPPATNDPYSVLCDQIIFVKKPARQ